MKKGVVIILLLFTGWLGMAQNADEESMPGIADYIWVDKKPVPLNLETVMAGIPYPYQAIRAGVEGATFARVLVDEEGKYKAHKITRELHPSLSEVLGDHLSHLTFSPAMQGEEPVQYWLNMTFNFRASDAVRKQSSRHKRSAPILAGLFQKDTREEDLAEGIERIREGGYNEAIQTLSRTLSSNNLEKGQASDLTLRAYFYRANAHMALAQWEQSEGDLTEALGRMGAVDGDSARQALQASIFLNRGIARLYQDRPVDALEDFNWLYHHLSAHLYHPGSAILETHLGATAYQDVLPMMVQLAYYNDQNPVVDFLVGHICRRLNMAEAAAEAFIAAISKAENPVFKAVVYDHLGETLLDLGQYSEALATAQEAIALTPGHPLPYYNQAIALLRLNDPKAAQAAMEAAVEKGLTEPEMTTARSLLQEKKNEALAGQP